MKMVILKGKMFLTLVAILVILMVNEAYATKHVVGGSSGWDESTDYDSWSKAQTFKLGDTLAFKYTSPLHSVVELGSEKEYKECDISNAANSMSTGNDVVKLDKVGTRYFTCGTSGHCTAGMKLKVNVVSAAGSPSPSPSPSPSDSSSDSPLGSSPSSLGSSSPPPSSGSTSSSTPSSSDATKTYKRHHGLFYSFSFVVLLSVLVAGGSF